ncbi:MAG: sulfatase-like hydrolase/transferase [Candidatus Eisenbacteria bacterium]|nr:sulfatase-like hydrolase/transferase [Candidatus Eisenbacteria bacterium]
MKSKAKPSPTTRRKTPTRGRGFHLGLARSLALGAVLLVAVILGLRFLRPGGTHSFAASELNGRGWNVILISLDTARPDAYAATAGPSAPVPSPGLDRLLGGGIRMSQMISPVPITLPGHATMLTGLDPHRHGVRENTEYALSPGAETLAERFRAAGYRTAAFVSSFVMDARFGLAQGFELYEDRLSGPEAGLRLGNVELPGGVTTARAAVARNAGQAGRHRTVLPVSPLLRSPCSLPSTRPLRAGLRPAAVSRRAGLSRPLHRTASRHAGVDRPGAEHRRLGGERSRRVAGRARRGDALALHLRRHAARGLFAPHAAE